VPPGERLVIMTPGGGGLGAAAERDEAAVRRDVEDELIGPDAAASVYGKASLT